MSRDFSINDVVVSAADLAEALEVVSDLPTADRTILEIRFVRLVEHFGTRKGMDSLGAADRVRAIEARLLALARLHAEGHPGLRGWVLPCEDPEAIRPRAELLHAVASEPLVERDGRFEFDEESLFRRVLAVAGQTGEA